MSFRILSLIGALAVAGLLVAQTVSQPENGSTAPALPEEGVTQIIPASLPAQSLDLSLAAGTSITLRADVLALPDGLSWPALTIGDVVLSIAKISFDGEYVAFLDEGLDTFAFYTSDQIEVEAIRAPDGATIVLYVDGRLIATVPAVGTSQCIINGLEDGIVEVSLGGTLRAADIPGKGHASLSSVLLEGGSFADLEIPRGAEMIRDHGQLISRQDLLKSVKASLGARAGALALKNMIFLDQETGDDAFDGTQMEVDHNSRRGPKKTWDAAQKVVKSGGTLLVLGNNGVYIAANPLGGMPADSTLITMGDMLVGDTQSIDALFASGRWIMTASGPSRAAVDLSKTVDETEQ